MFLGYLISLSSFSYIYLHSYITLHSYILHYLHYIQLHSQISTTQKSIIFGPLLTDQIFKTNLVVKMYKTKLFPRAYVQ